MNINEIPDPPIKPTRTPKIVKDQDKEAFFSAGANIGGAPTRDYSNPNAQPHQGGIWHQINQQLAQIEQASKATRRARTSQDKGGAWIFTVIVTMFIMGSVMVNIFSEYSDDASELVSNQDNQSPAPSEEYDESTTPEDVESIAYENQATNCLSLDVPEGSSFETDSPLNGEYVCEVSFYNGFTSASDGFAYNGEFSYTGPIDYISVLGYEVIDVATVGDISRYEIADSGIDGLKLYIFWVRDFNLPGQSADSTLQAIHLYLYDLEAGANDVDQAIAQTALDTFTIELQPQ